MNRELKKHCGHCGSAGHSDDACLGAEHVIATLREENDELRDRCRVASMDALEVKGLLAKARDAINEHCSCDGSGPGYGCVACDIYHEAGF